MLRTPRRPAHRGLEAVGAGLCRVGLRGAARPFRALPGARARKNVSNYTLSHSRPDSSSKENCGSARSVFFRCAYNITPLRLFVKWETCLNLHRIFWRFSSFRRISCAFGAILCAFRHFSRSFDRSSVFSTVLTVSRHIILLFRHAAAFFDMRMHPSGMHRTPGCAPSAVPSDPGCAAGCVSLRMRVSARAVPFRHAPHPFGMHLTPDCTPPAPTLRRQMSCCSFIMSLNCIPRVSAALRQRTMRCMNISK